MEDEKPVTPPTNTGSGRSQDHNVVRLGRDIQVKIGQHLRTVYDEVVKEGVPDRLSDLLAELDKAVETHPKK